MSNSHQPFDVAPRPKYVPQELWRKVTAPIAATEIREYFTNPDIQFMIICKESRLKGSALLTYLTNLNMPSDLLIDLTDYEEYSQLLKAYFEQRTIVKSHSLTALAGEVIMYFSLVEREHHPHRSPVSEEWLEKFCDENVEVLSIWRIFLDSMLLYIGRNIMKLEFNDNKELAILDDRDAIGQNIVNLICAPDFLRSYFAHASLEAQVYFKQQFEQQMFNGRDLAYYFFSPGNYVNTLLNGELVKAMQSEEGKLLRDYVRQQMKEGFPP